MIMFNTHSGNCMLEVFVHFLDALKKRVDKLAKVFLVVSLKQKISLIVL
jgi:hypothetical protein